MHSSNFSSDTRVTVTLRSYIPVVSSCPDLQVREWYIAEQNGYEFSYYFACNHFLLFEAVNDACPKEDVPNRTTLHRLVTKFQGTRRLSKQHVWRWAVFTGRGLQSYEDALAQHFAMLHRCDLWACIQWCSFPCDLNGAPCILDTYNGVRTLTTS
jgi:hypothetical protein